MSWLRRKSHHAEVTHLFERERVAGALSHIQILAQEYPNLKAILQTPWKQMPEASVPHILFPWETRLSRFAFSSSLPTPPSLSVEHAKKQSVPEPKAVEAVSPAPEKEKKAEVTYKEIKETLRATHAPPFLLADGISLALRGTPQRQCARI
jgi:hypothetical protein